MKRLLTIAMTLVLVLGANALVNAETVMINFNAWTNGEDESIAFWVTVVDRVTTPPARVTSIIVTAPDGTTFDTLRWFDQDYGFYTGRKYAGDFDGGVIPSGVYTVDVQDKNGQTFTATDEVNINFLAVPVVKNPTDGSTLSTLTPTLKWKEVPGAEVYRIHLWNESWNEPIWWWRENKRYCNQNKFKMPKGVLWSGFNYRLQIQARDTLKDTDNRASSNWVYFDTP